MKTRDMATMRAIRAAAFATIALSVCGCSTPIVTSQPWDGPLAPASPHDDVETIGSYWLPTVKFPIHIKREKCVVKVEIEDAAFYPDVRHHYVARFHKDDFTADDVSLATDSNGLLKSVNASSEPKGVEVIGKVLETAGDIAKLAGAEMLAMPCDTTTTKDVDLTYPIDPSDAADIDALNDKLRPDGMRISIGMKRAQPDSDAFKSGAIDQCDIKDNKDAKSNRYVSGVCYRPIAAYKLDIEVTQTILKTKATKKHPVPKTALVSTKLSKATFIPDPMQILRISLDRHGPAKTDIKLGFDHGLLTSYEDNQPSRALVIVGIPADILKGVLGLVPSPSSAGGGK